MNRNLLFLASFIGLVSVTEAAVITPEEALQKAREEMTKVSLTRSLGEATLELNNLIPAFTLATEKGEPALYVFNKKGNAGTVFLSADDNTEIILGYTDEGSLEEETMAPALAYWLNEYTRQISDIREAGDVLSSANSTYTEVMAPIAPLLSTKWNQDQPYNDDCEITFTDGTVMQCMTGCVATAMAQVMKFFEYPAAGVGSITYNPYSNTLPLEMDFSARNFDWDNMLDKYVTDNYNDTEASAVAYLMKACGYSVSMQYGKNESGADPRRILNALINYFKYAKSSRYLERSNFTLKEWVELLHNHLEVGGPIIYNGDSLNGGHSFVCDGYQGAGYFHFNWGWGGLSDGYFLIDVLNPTAQGIGGYSGGYNLSQSAILPVMESNVTVYTPVKQFGSLEGRMISGTNLSLTLTKEERDEGWTYNGIGDSVFNFGLIVEEINAPGSFQYLPTTLQNVEFLPSTIVISGMVANLSSLSLENDKIYQLTLATYHDGQLDEQWLPVVVSNGLYNYVVIKKTDSGFEVIPNKARKLEVDSLEVLSPLYYGSAATFKSVITNPSNIELTRYLSVGFIDSEGYLRYISDYTAVTVNPGEKIEKEWLSNHWSNIQLASPPTAIADYTMVLYDVVSQTIIEGDYTSTVTVMPQMNLNYNLTTNLTDGETIDALNSTVVVSVDVETGYFSKIISLQIVSPVRMQQPDGTYTNSYSSDNMVYSLSSDLITLESGESSDVEFNVYFPDYERETLYLVVVSVDGSWTSAKSFVSFESDGTVEYRLYDMPSIVTPTPGSYKTLEKVYLSWEGVETLAFDSESGSEVTVNGSVVSGDGLAIIGNVLAVSINSTVEGEYTVVVPEGLLIINNGFINREETLSFEVMKEAGIEGITVDADGIYHVYRIDGTAVTRTKNSNDIRNLPSGLYIINGQKILIAK